MKIGFSEISAAKAKILVLGIGEDKKLTPLGKELDGNSKGTLSKALKLGKFAGKKGQTLLVEAPAGLAQDRILLVGLGKVSELSDLAMQSVGGTILRTLNGMGATAASVAIELLPGGKVTAPHAAVQVAYGALLKSYRFDKYRTKEPKEDKPTLTSLTVMCKGATTATKAFGMYEDIAGGVFFTRDLVSEPANIIYPVSLANKCRELTKLGVEVEVMGVKQMQKLGMGALLGVGQGSANESQLVVMQWKGDARQKTAPLAFIGKGVTFDTGGISIKPAGGMEDMKWDMAGAGAVVGLMRALASRKAKVNVVGVVGLVENMPSGTAQRPGDVVTSMSGQTIEVINTDAEGRLVLSDALWYTKERFKPRFMINLATLTGAIIIALGTSRAGLFSNDDKLSQQLLDSGKASGEELWRLPLGDVYDKQINSFIADMKNVGEGREAGSITAAQFLQRFVGEVPWAHLDIAGVAWTNKDLDTVPKGASAFGVRLLDQLIRDHYE